MFKKNETVNLEKIDTLIGKNSRFEGILTADGTIRIDGEFRGDVHVKGNVIVGIDGKVWGNITAHNVFNSGMIEGNITVDGMLRITASGRVFGDISVGALVVEEKAKFQGKCSMKENHLSNRTSDLEPYTETA